MGMTGKSALYALAVVVLTGSMAVAALAGVSGLDMIGTPESSGWAQPEQGVEQPNAGEIREPVETGAVPDRPESSSDLYCCMGSGDPTSFRVGGP